MTEIRRPCPYCGKIGAAPSSTYGVAIMTRGHDAPIAIPDEWIEQWITLCNGNKDLVLAELRKAEQWNLDNPHNRKTMRGLRRHLGLWIMRAWEKNNFGRPKFSGSLAGHEKKN
jgi:hypothetical protein